MLSKEKGWEINRLLEILGLPLSGKHKCNFLISLIM